MRIFFSGSRRKLPPQRHGPFAEAGCEIGRELGRRNHIALLYSAGENTLDHHLVAGLRLYSSESRTTPEVELHRELGSKRIFEDRSGLMFKEVPYPRPLVDSDRRLGARVGAIAASDAVLLMGGDSGTRKVGQMAYSLSKPVMAVPSFDGSAKDLFERLETQYLARPGVSQRLHSFIPRWRPESSASAVLDICELLGGRHTYFLSYPHKHHELADHVEMLLLRAMATVVRDERSLELGDDLRGEVRERIARADTFLSIWNCAASDSEWCCWELDVARQSKEKSGRPRRIVLLIEDQTDLPAFLKDTLQPQGGGRPERVLAIKQLVENESAGGSAS